MPKEQKGELAGRERESPASTPNVNVQAVIVIFRLYVITNAMDVLLRYDIP